MTTNEIVSAENNNHDKIILYKEGIFYKAYEKSAYAFVLRLNQYAPKKKFIKIISSYIISIGFPIASLAKYKDKIEIVENTDKWIIIKTDNIDIVDFENWKNSLPIHKSKSNDEVTQSIAIQNDIKSHNPIIDMIRSFRLKNKTPIECMLFIEKLKQEVDGCI